MILNKISKIIIKPFHKIPIFSKLLITKYKQQVRYEIKGNKILIRNFSRDFIFEIKRKLSFISFSQFKDNKYFKIDDLDINNSLSQKIQTQIIDIDLSRAINHSIYKKRKIKYPLPEEYQKVLEKNGLKTNKFICNLLWFSLVSLYFGRGIYRSCRYIFSSLKNLLFNDQVNFVSNYIYFDELQPYNFENYKVENSNLFNILKFSDNNNIDSVKHNTKNFKNQRIRNKKFIYQKYPIGLIISYEKLIKAIFVVINLLVESLINMIFKKWGLAFLYEDLFFAKITLLQDHNKLAKSYYFYYNWRYRPIWTYIAEKKNSDILFYFYSTNCEGIKTSKGYQKTDFTHTNLTWPKYLVYDVYQKNWIQRNTKSNFNSKFEIIGPLLVNNNKLNKEKIIDNSIVVFDISPVRDYHYNIYACPNKYDLPITSIMFYKDISFICKEIGLNLLIKTKRPINKSSDCHPKYRNYLNKLGKENHVSILNRNTSIEDLINNTLLSISMPFTSTSLVAESLGKPTCYYDSKGEILSDDKGAHGIEIIIGTANLLKWIKGKIKKF